MRLIKESNKLEKSLNRIVMTWLFSMSAITVYFNGNDMLNWARKKMK